MKIISRVFSILVSLLVFILLVKFFYIDTKLGLETDILGFTMFSAPMFIEVLLSIPTITFIVYALIDKLLSKLLTRVLQYKKTDNTLGS